MLHSSPDSGAVDVTADYPSAPRNSLQQILTDCHQAPSLSTSFVWTSGRGCGTLILARLSCLALFCVSQYLARQQ